MNGWSELGSESLVGDDPESVRQLRKLIVVLAMSGRLSADSDTDVDGHTIARQIDAAKQRLVANGLLRRCEATTVIASNDLPDVLPSSGYFVRLGSVAKVEKGLTGIQQAMPGPFPLVVTAEGRATCDHFDFDSAAAIVPLVSSAGHGKASLQRLHYQEGKFALGSILAAAFPYAPELVSARFLYEYLTAFKDELLVSQMIGTANVSLSIGKVSDVPVPLLSPAVQKRVDELMEQCDRLEAARAECEAARDRLTAASLARLNAPDHETFAEDARFALDALPALTVQPEHIEQFRQAILNLAALGKLVAQDSRDGAVSLPPPRQYSAASGLDESVYKQFHDSIALPVGWKIAPLAQISEHIVDCPHTTPKWTSRGELCVRTNQLRPRKLDLSEPRYVSQEAYVERTERLVPREGDILYSREGGILGVACRVPKELRLCLGQRLMLIRACPAVAPAYLEIVLNSPFITEIAKRLTTGGAAPRVNMSTVRAYPVPVPPLAEQLRIVAAVDELTTICDRLEASLSHAAERRGRLLESLLHEVLQPSESIGEAA